MLVATWGNLIVITSINTFYNSGWYDPDLDYNNVWEFETLGM